MIGNKALGKELGTKGRHCSDEMKAAHAAASETIFQQRNLRNASAVSNRNGKAYALYSHTKSQLQDQDSWQWHWHHEIPVTCDTSFDVISDQAESHLAHVEYSSKLHVPGKLSVFWPTQSLPQQCLHQIIQLPPIRVTRCLSPCNIFAYVFACDPRRVILAPLHAQCSPTGIHLGESFLRHYMRNLKPLGCYSENKSCAKACMIA